MILDTELGWIYIKNDKIFVKNINFFTYIFYWNDIKIENDEIFLKNKENLNLTVKNCRIDILLNMVKENKINMTEIVLNKKSLWNYDVISWAMTKHNKKILTYGNEFNIAFCDVGFLINYPIKFKIKEILVEKNKNKINFFYSIEDSSLIYVIINEWFEFYEYTNEIQIKIGEKSICWKESQILKISDLFNRILENRNCSIELMDDDIYYEMSIHYKEKDITSTI